MTTQPGVIITLHKPSLAENLSHGGTDEDEAYVAEHIDAYIEQVQLLASETDGVTLEISYEHSAMRHSFTFYEDEQYERTELFLEFVERSLPDFW